jgi:hypothetical protein
MLAPCVLATCCAIAFVACLEFPAQAQQSTPQTLPSIESPQKEREKLKKRIKRMEDMLKKFKVEREREKLVEKEVEERLDKGKLSLEEIEKKFDQGKLMLKELEEKLDQGKRALKEADERLDRGKLRLEELEAESERQKRKWDTRFDKIRRDPRNRLQGTGADAGWISMPGKKTDIRFGGFIQLNIIHDFQNSGNNFGKFSPAEIPVPTDGTSNTEFDPRTSRMIFETRTLTSLGKYSTFLSADWAGDEANSSSPDFRLRQAYVTGVGLLPRAAFTAGRANSTFMDNLAWPEIFDLEGPNSLSFIWQGLLRLSWEVDEAKHWIASFALEQPDTDVTNGDGKTDWPDAVARIDVNHDWGHLSAAVLGRRLKATSTTGTGTDTAAAWGLLFSGKLPVPGTADNIVFQVQGGDGIGRYIEDLNFEGGQDAVYDTTKEKLRPLKEVGGFGAYQHWWTDKLRSTATGGYLRVDNLNIQSSDSLKASIYTSGNLIYSPVKPLDVGIEYIWGQRKNKNGQTGRANRLMFSMKWHL